MCISYGSTPPLLFDNTMESLLKGPSDEGRTASLDREFYNVPKVLFSAFLDLLEEGNLFIVVAIAGLKCVFYLELFH